MNRVILPVHGGGVATATGAHPTGSRGGRRPSQALAPPLTTGSAGSAPATVVTNTTGGVNDRYRRSPNRVAAGQRPVQALAQPSTHSNRAIPATPPGLTRPPQVSAHSQGVTTPVSDMRCSRISRGELVGSFYAVCSPYGLSLNHTMAAGTPCDTGARRPEDPWADQDPWNNSALRQPRDSLGATHPTGQAAENYRQVPVPSDLVGAFIGKAGAAVRELVAHVGMPIRVRSNPGT